MRKPQALNKVQRQLRPEPYFPEFFKSRAQDGSVISSAQTDGKPRFTTVLRQRSNQV